jgi:hypothetical protein
MRPAASHAISCSELPTRASYLCGTCQWAFEMPAAESPEPHDHMTSEQPQANFRSLMPVFSKCSTTDPQYDFTMYSISTGYGWPLCLSNSREQGGPKVTSESTNHGGTQPTCDKTGTDQSKECGSPGFGSPYPNCFFLPCRPVHPVLCTSSTRQQRDLLSLDKLYAVLVTWFQVAKRLVQHTEIIGALHHNGLIYHLMWVGHGLDTVTVGTRFCKTMFAASGTPSRRYPSGPMRTALLPLRSLCACSARAFRGNLLNAAPAIACVDSEPHRRK